MRKLGLSGNILLTIRTYLDPLGALHRRPDRVTIAAYFADQLDFLMAARPDYKNFAGDRGRLADALRPIGSPAN